MHSELSQVSVRLELALFVRIAVAVHVAFLVRLQVIKVSKLVLSYRGAFSQLSAFDRAASDSESVAHLRLLLPRVWASLIEIFLAYKIILGSRVYRAANAVCIINCMQSYSFLQLAWRACYWVQLIV